MDYKIFGVETKLDIFEKYAQAHNRPLILVDRIGINNSEDSVAIENAFNFYQEILTPEIFALFKTQPMFSILFHSNDFALEYAREYFPLKDTSPMYPELEVIATVMDGSGNITYCNQS